MTILPYPIFPLRHAVVILLLFPQGKLEAPLTIIPFAKTVTFQPSYFIRSIYQGLEHPRDTDLRNKHVSLNTFKIRLKKHYYIQCLICRRFTTQRIRECVKCKRPRPLADVSASYCF